MSSKKQNKKTELSLIEKQVLKLVCQDKANTEIAEKIDKGLRYTEKIKTKLYKKTGTSSSLGLFKWAVINGYFAFKR